MTNDTPAPGPVMRTEREWTMPDFQDGDSMVTIDADGMFDISIGSQWTTGVTPDQARDLHTLIGAALAHIDGENPKETPCSP